MKMYEKLNINPTTEEGLAKLFNIHCMDIPDNEGDISTRNENCPHPDLSCNECKAKRLLAEVPTKKVQRGTTYTDFEKAHFEYLMYQNHCVEYDMDYPSFSKWLAEEIEVEDDN